MPKSKSKVLRIRVSDQMYKFLSNTVKEMNKFGNPQLTLSDLIRSIMEYFLISYTIGEWNKPLSQLRKEFKSYLASVTKPQSKRLKGKTQSKQVKKSR